MNKDYWDDGFWLIPVEDEWFLPERDCPKSGVLKSRPLQNIIINQRTWVKDSVEDHLDVIDNMTSSIFNYLKNDENITNLQISACKSKCTFFLSGLKVDFALSWFWQYAVNWTIISDKIYNHELLDKIYAAVFFDKIKEKYPDSTIWGPWICSDYIDIILDPTNPRESSFHVIINRKIRRIFIARKRMGDGDFEKIFMMDDFLKRLPEIYLGIKKIEK